MTYDTIKNFARKAGFGIALLAGSFGLEGRVNAVMVPPGYKADTSASISALANYSSVETGPNFDNMYGNILFQDGNQVPVGDVLWLLRNSDRAVVGRFATTNNTLEGFFRPYGETGVDNGLVVGNLLDAVLQGSDNKFYNADFNTPVTYQDKEGAPAIRADITVKGQITPEPGTASLLAAGFASLLGYLRLKRK
jgi:hypothetical protein